MKTKNKDGTMYAATSLFPLPLFLPSSFLSIEALGRDQFPFRDTIGSFGAPFPADPLCSSVISIINRQC